MLRRTGASVRGKLLDAIRAGAVFPASRSRARRQARFRPLRLRRGEFQAARSASRRPRAARPRLGFRRRSPPSSHAACQQLDRRRCRATSPTRPSSSATTAAASRRRRSPSPTPRSPGRYGEALSSRSARARLGCQTRFRSSRRSAMKLRTMARVAGNREPVGGAGCGG